jgi:hypothetical protein
VVIEFILKQNIQINTTKIFIIRKVVFILNKNYACKIKSAGSLAPAVKSPGQPVPVTKHNHLRREFPGPALVPAP